MVAGDFTGNGTLDLAVADPGDEVYGQGDDPGGVYVLLGNGDGTFQTATVYASGGGATEPGSIVAGDFTGNGKLDLAVASDLFNELLILPGNGDGTFQPPIETPLNLPNFGQSLFLSIVAGDFNRDGRVNVAVADDTTNGFGVAPPNVVTDSFEVLLGNGDGTFEQGGGTLIDGGTAPLITADFNGDGNLDLATYNYATDEVSISLGNGGGGFQLASQFALGAPTAAGELMVAGDFNGDGRHRSGRRCSRWGLRPAGEWRRHVPARDDLFARVCSD